jgi:hypothetical protein
MLRPFRAAARRVTINFRRIARMAFKGAKQATQPLPPPPAADEDATPVSDSLDYFWQHHWQNEMDASSAEIPETEPGRDFSADYDGRAGPSLDL